MSFAINVEEVGRVLLQDGWHSVHEGSFEVSRRLVFQLGEEMMLVHDPPAFTFVERREWRRVRVSGQLAQVLALEERVQGGAGDEAPEEDEEFELAEEFEP